MEERSHGCRPHTALARFHSIRQTAVENVGILQPVTQLHGEPLMVYLREKALEEYGMAHVGFFPFLITIKIHHVTLPEIGQEVFALIGHGKRDGVIAIVVVAALLVGDGQFHVDVAAFTLLCQRHVPGVCAVERVPVTVAHPTDDLFHIDEVVHPAEIAPFQGRERMKDGCDILLFWKDIAMIERTPVVVDIERLGSEQRKCRRQAVLCHPEIECHHLVSELDGFAEELLIE